jgi:hypothetical protein
LAILEAAPHLKLFVFILRNSIKHEFGVPKFVEPSGMNQARVPTPVDQTRASISNKRKSYKNGVVENAR